MAKNNNFEVLVQTRLDLSKIQNDIDSIKKKFGNIEFSVDFSKVMGDSKASAAGTKAGKKYSDAFKSQMASKIQFKIDTRSFQTQIDALATKMETLNAVLPILLYIAAIVLLIVLIIIGIRVLGLLDRVDKVIEDVEGKVESVNNAITTMNKAVSGIANISDSVIFGITSVASKVFNKKRKEEEDKVYE